MKRKKPERVEKSEVTMERLERKRATGHRGADLRSHLSVTEAASVSTKTRESYVRLLHAFLSRQGLRKAELTSVVLDRALIAFFDRLYLEGRDPSAGQKLAAAVLFHFPLLMGSSPQAQLPRTFRALKGWRKLMPARTRRPLPWVVVASIARRLLRGPCPPMALCWLMMVDCYLRPGEAVDLKPSQVIPGTPDTAMDRCALHVNPDYRQKYSKTGELDESLLVSRRWLGRAIEQWAMRRKGEAELWPFTLAAIRHEFVKHALALGLAALKPVLYMGRHSGASLDRLENRYGLSEVQRRGRWRSTSSVARYEKHALVQQVYQSLGRRKAMIEAEAQELLRDVSTRFGGTRGNEISIGGWATSTSGFLPASILLLKA